MAASPEKQWRRRALQRAPSSSTRSTSSWRRGRGSAAACRAAWRGRCASGTTPAAPTPSGSPGSSRGRSRRPRRPAGRRGQPLDLGVGGRPSLDASPGTRGVQRDGRDDPLVPVRGLDDPAGAGRSSADRDDPGHADGAASAPPDVRGVDAARRRRGGVVASTVGHAHGSGGCGRARAARHSALGRQPGARDPRRFARARYRRSGQLLVYDRLVQLGEDRRRLAHQACRPPSASTPSAPARRRSRR